MFKKIFLLTVLVVFCFATEEAIIDDLSAAKTGGYQTVKKEKLHEMLEDPTFHKAEKEARSHYLSYNGASLGQVINVETQVVAGINYKITFETRSGPTEIIVWVQPWT